MPEPRVPQEFILERSQISGVFREIAAKLGHTDQRAERLTRILPESLRTTTVWRDRLTNLWRYDYGPPYDALPGDQLVLGTTQWPQVRSLYQSVHAAESRLGSEELVKWLARLSDPAKHVDALVEMRPVVGLAASANAQFEVTGRGEGNKTIDWLVEPKAGRPLLLDVKNRIADLLDHLRQMMPAMQAARHPATPNAPDPSVLFRNTVEKFRGESRSVQLQGVWIHSEIKQDKNRVTAYFRGLDPSRLHFAVLADWDDDATILVRDETDGPYLEQVFAVVASSRFLTDDYGDSGRDL
jgi:hypothetical protein